MNRLHGPKSFSTARVKDDQAGYAGLELWSLQNNRSEKAASVIYWDASGHWFVETYGEVPLEILQECIAEAQTVFPSSC